MVVRIRGYRQSKQDALANFYQSNDSSSEVQNNDEEYEPEPLPLLM